MYTLDRLGSHYPLLDLHPNGIRYLSNNDQLVYDFVYYHSNRYYQLQSNRSHLKYRQRSETSRFLKIKNDLLEQHYEQLRQHIQEVNTLRLEFVQEMENLQDLMHTDQTKAKNYVEKILEEAKNFEMLCSFCNHQVTNLILARYQKLAAKRNIQITFQADLPEELPINDDDLAQLLIHALEHSFRETHAIENPLYRKIYLSIHEQEEHFVICCEHSAHYDTNLFSRGITEELDDQERFDLMMMKDVADRYTGTLTQEKDTFIDRITVQLSRNYPNPV